MKARLLKIILLFIVLPGVLLLALTSCPQSLSEADVLAAQDKLSPLIQIISPGENATYYSTVDFEVKIRDDAESSSDGKGDLASVAFDISNDDLRGGRVLIASNGSLTQDASYGPDEIIYDKANGLVNFSFSTIEPNTISGLISVTILAEDRNGNLTEEKITLLDSEGPWIDFTVVDLNDIDSDGNYKDRSYTEGTTVRLIGTVGNSGDNKEEADQITTISWKVLGKSWSGYLEIDEDAAYVDTYSGDTLNYYNAALEQYERYNEGFAFADYLFIYDPVTRSFTTDVDIPFGAGSVLPFEVSVEDRNDHSSSLTVNAFSDESGPEITITYPNNSNDAYFSINTDNSDAITGYINGGTADLQSFKYQLSDTTGTYSSVKIDQSDTSVIFDGNSFTIYPDLSKLSDEGYVLGDGDVNLTIFAINDQDFESRPKILMYEDNEGPDFTSISLVSDSVNSSYANDDSILIMSISADDESTDVNEMTASVDIGIYSNPDVTIGESLYVDNWNDTVYSDDYLPYTIDVSDRLGNITTINQDSVMIPQVPQLMYYSGAPDVNHLDSLAMMGENPPYNYAIAGEDIIINLDSTRILEEINSVSATGFSTTISDGGDATQKTITLSRSDIDVETDAEFSITLTDAAGNMASLSQLDITSGTVVLYDSKAPAAPSVPTLAAADDTTLTGYAPGPSDGITKNTANLTIEGTAEADSTVKVYVDGSLTEDFSTSADGSGDWWGDLNGTFSQGSYSIVVNTTDPAGNQSADSPAFSLEVWTDLPSDPLSIDLRTIDDSSRTGLAGGNADNITNIADVNIDGVTEAGGYIILYKDGAAENYITADGSGDWEKLISLDDGDKTYSLVAKAADIAGNESSGSVTLDIMRDTLNTSIPTIALDPSDDKGYSDSDGITNQYSNLTFTGSVTDDDSYGIKLSGLHSDGLTAVSGLAGLTASEVNGDWFADADLDSGTDEDTLTVSAVSVDSAGNESAPGSTTVIIDSTAPALSAVDSIDLLSAFDSGIDNTDDITNESDPLEFDINVSAYIITEIRAVNDALYIEISSDQEPNFLDRTEITSTGVITLTTDRALTEADHTVSARVYDKAGNPSDALPVSLSLSVDRTAPALTDISLLALAVSSDSGYSDSDGKTNIITPLTFSYTVVDYEEPGYLELYSDENSNVRGTAVFTADGTGLTVTSLSGFNKIVHNMSVKLYDSAGNEKTGITGSCLIDVDNTPPNESISAFELATVDDWGISSSDGKTAKDTALEFDMTFSAHSEFLYVTLESDQGPTVIASLKDVDTWDKVADSALPEGSNTVTAFLYDVYGNLDDTRNTTVITDYQNPLGTLVSMGINSTYDTGISNTDKITNVDQLQFDFDLSGLDEASYIAVSSDQESFSDNSAELATSNSTAAVLTRSGLSEKTHSFTAQLFDIYGNSSGSTLVLNNIKLDHTPPVTNISNLTLNSSSDLGVPGDEMTAEQGALTFDFDLSTTGFENPSYILLESDKEASSVIQETLYTSAGTDKTITSTSGLVEDVHIITATVYDEAGNESSGTSSDSFTLTTDYTAQVFSDTEIDDGTVTIDSISYDSLVVRPGELYDSVLGGTGVVGDFQDLAADLYFDPHANISGYSVKGKVDSNNLVILLHDGTDFFSFPNGTGYVLNFGASFTDEAGNRILQSNGIDVINEVGFDYAAAGTSNITQAGLTLPSLTVADVSEEVESSPVSRSKNRFSSSASIIEIDSMPTAAENKKVTQEKDIAFLKQTATHQPAILIPEKSVDEEEIKEESGVKPAKMTETIKEYSHKDLIEFMENVEQNRLEYETALNRLRRMPQPQSYLDAMEQQRNPAIPAIPETVIYMSPLPLAFEEAVILAGDHSASAESTASKRFLLLQILGGAIMLLITAGFIWSIRWLQRVEK